MDSNIPFTTVIINAGQFLGPGANHAHCFLRNKRARHCHSPVFRLQLFIPPASELNLDMPDVGAQPRHGRRRVFQCCLSRFKRTTTNLLVSKLNTLPNRNATREQLKMMTLYGMLKSGVARSTRSAGVYIRPLAGLPDVPFLEGSKGVNIAGGRSHPRCASGGCSVYRRNALVTSMVRWSVL